jgi:uncharacterized protein (DUF1697 family)
MRQIVLLRGINVGKAKRVAMAELRELLTSLGHSDVKTVLNSGNAVVTTGARAAQTEQAVHAAIADRFGLDVAVVVRSSDQLASAMAADPFRSVATNGARHFLGFCSAAPEAAVARRLTGMSGDDFQVAVDGRHLYLWCPSGLLDSGFAALDLARLLGVDCTLRNWNTVEKLVALSD